ncbi:iron-containing alcohol dehydrogenase [Malacoplasma muris]|uniref:iron-containing alcohol dehydrogenase n=1 Tax=Malacoplasma muris TaxID=2119 RepID=UPI00398F40BE
MNYYNLKPRYYFGEGAVSCLEGEFARRKFKKALILYGGGSIKLNGAYDDVVKQLQKANIDFVEFSGIEPNPRDTTITSAIDFVINNGVDLILAVGGGSVVDASKVIATLATNRSKYNTVWDYVTNPKQLQQLPIPIISVITLAGTGSENNAGSVVTNLDKKLKKGVHQQYAIPYVAIEDPTYTYTVNAWQTASGIFDCFSHLLEQYFGQNTFEWTKEIIFAQLRVLLKYAKFVIDNPTDFTSRANILWTTSMALNSTTSFASDSDWNVHTLEHAFSGKWDITHGAGLALITPTYLEIRGKKEEWFYKKVEHLGKEVFKVSNFEETILFLKSFIKAIGLPLKWNEFKEITSFDESDVNELLNHSLQFGDESLKETYLEVLNTLKNDI